MNKLILILNKLLLIRVVIVAMVFGVLVIPGITRGATVNALSCSQADVQAAIDSASDGNTVMVPAGSATYYIDYENGLDSNAGTSKDLPWKHAPGMKGCSGNCLAYQTAHPNPTATTGAGDQFILKGGITTDLKKSRRNRFV